MHQFKTQTNSQFIYFNYFSYKVCNNTVLYSNIMPIIKLIFGHLRLKIKYVNNLELHRLNTPPRGRIHDYTLHPRVLQVVDKVNEENTSNDCSKHPVCKQQQQLQQTSCV